MSQKVCPRCALAFDADAIRCGQCGGVLLATDRPGASLGPGDVIDGRYEILERLGEGGMGTVYRARQASVGRDVAVKVLGRDLGANLDIIKRFLREAKASSNLSHPNIVVTHDFGQTPQGALYLVMELIKGRTLASLLEVEARLEPERVVRIAAQVLDALAEAHDKGIVHRDLKPENIMLVQKAGNPDMVKVLDFGIAKLLYKEADEATLTKTGQLVGTPPYMAPELLRDGAVTTSSDLYALGCIVYEMLAGFPPFYEGGAMTVMLAHVQTPPPPLAEVMPPDEVHPALEELVMGALSKTAEERPADARAFKRALLRAIRGSDDEPMSHELVMLHLKGASAEALAAQEEAPTGALDLDDARTVVGVAAPRSPSPPSSPPPTTSAPEEQSDLGIGIRRQWNPVVVFGLGGVVMTALFVGITFAMGMWSAKEDVPPPTVPAETQEAPASSTGKEPPDPSIGQKAPVHSVGKDAPEPTVGLEAPDPSAAQPAPTAAAAKAGSDEAAPSSTDEAPSGEGKELADEASPGQAPPEDTEPAPTKTTSTKQASKPGPTKQASKPGPTKKKPTKKPPAKKPPKKKTTPAEVGPISF